jgi:GH15 family glucan-1,4-alpha-glucosidase
MPVQSWAVAADGGYLYSDELSTYLRQQVQPLCKFRQFCDAEDGILSKNPIEHGHVDSILGLYTHYQAGEKKLVRYWLTAGDSITRALELNTYVLKKSPDHLVKTAGNFWRAWINKYPWSFYKMSPETIGLFQKSLMFVRAHVDDGGGIIASADAEVLKYDEDTYAYVWTRDAAYAALALDHAGDTNVAERFFDFCNAVISKDGYFMHKYLPDQSLGSSWHPWTRDGAPQLPIQEDETALVIWALAGHYKHSRDLEFIEKLYNPLIEKAANFMAAYRDTTTGLPKPSYDLWEERRGVSTFTSAAVYGARWHQPISPDIRLPVVMSAMWLVKPSALLANGTTVPW